MAKAIKASQLIEFLEKAIDVYGDVDIVNEIYDHSDHYGSSIKDYTVPVEGVRAESSLLMTEDQQQSSIRLISHIGVDR